MDTARHSTEHRKITFEEYLALEKESETRNEFHDGEIVPLEATTKAHNQIKRRLIRNIETPEFEASGCELFDENVATVVQEGKRIFYPDIVVSCNPEDDDPYLVHTPQLIIEILSESTKKYDKTVKFFRYQRIPTLRQCVFIAQDEIEVRSFLRSEDNQWLLTLLNDSEDMLTFPSLGIGIKLSEIYRGILP